MKKKHRMKQNKIEKKDRIKQKKTQNETEKNN